MHENCLFHFHVFVGLSFVPVNQHLFLFAEGFPKCWCSFIFVCKKKSEHFYRSWRNWKNCNLICLFIRRNWSRKSSQNPKETYPSTQTPKKLVLLTCFWFAHFEVSLISTKFEHSYLTTHKIKPNFQKWSNFNPKDR